MLQFLKESDNSEHNSAISLDINSLVDASPFC